MLQEELLLQCHEAAVAAAQFTPAEDFDYDSSGSEVGRVPGGGGECPREVETFLFFFFSFLQGSGGK